MTLKNTEAEVRLIAATLADPNTTIPPVLGMGISWEDFFIIKLGWIWDAAMNLQQDGDIVTPSMITHYLKSRDRYSSNVDEVLTNLPETDPGEAIAWARVVKEMALRRKLEQQGQLVKDSAKNMEADQQQEIIGHQTAFDMITAGYTRLHNPMADNPADELRRSRGWSTSSGIYFIDGLVRWTSGEVHFVAGDPGSGKTSVAIQTGAYNARYGVPVTMIMAESDPIEVTMGMILQLQREGVDSRFVAKMLYDPSFRTEHNIKKVEQIWTDNFSNLPLRIYNADGGVEEVLSIIGSTTEPSLIIIDHAYAVIAQSQAPTNFKEHQQFISLFSRARKIAQRNNHIILMLNQFKLSGRGENDRGPDAQYGGSGVRNVAGSQIHLWADDNESTIAEGGARIMHAQCWKVRAMLVADEVTGETINPYGQRVDYWLDVRHRKVIPDPTQPIAMPL